MEDSDRDSDYADSDYLEDAELSENEDIEFDLEPGHPDYYLAHPTAVQHSSTDPSADRLLSDYPANLAVAMALPAESDQPPHRNTIPFYSAAAALAGESFSPALSANPRSGSPTYCVEDAVGLLNDPLTLGIVDRTFGDVDSHQPRPQRDYGEPIIRHADVPPPEFTRFLRSGVPPKGFVLVSWQTSPQTELIPEARLQLLERALCVGDVVKRGVDEHMSGVVVANRSFSTLFPATVFHVGPVSPAVAEGLTLRNVPANELLNVHELIEDAVVVHGDWVGRIVHVYDEVAVKLSNNSVVIVEDPSELEHTDPTVERLSVGDTVVTKKGNLRRGRWRFGAFDPNVRPQGVVVETRPYEIYVQWLARNLGAIDETSADMGTHASLGRDEFESPSFRLYDATGSCASTLPTSSNGTDRQYYVADIAMGDRVTFKDIAHAEAKYNSTNAGRLANGQHQGVVARIPRTLSLGYDMNVWLVMQTHTQVTVQWQDLTITNDLSTSLIPDIDIEDNDEVWPGEIVCSKEERDDATQGGKDSKRPARVGIVQTVRSRDRIATVRWFKDPAIEFFEDNLLRPASTGELDEAMEEVSLYDIYTSPALTQQRGDFVLLYPGAIESPQTPLNVTGPDWFGEIVDLGLDGRLTVRLGAAKPVIDVRVPYEGAMLAYRNDMDDLSMDFDLDSETDDEDEEVLDFDSTTFNEMWIEYEGTQGDQTAGNEEDWSTEDEDGDDENKSDVMDISVGGAETNKTSPESKTPPQGGAQTVALPSTSLSTSIPPLESIPTASSPVPEPFAILDQPPPTNHHFLTQSPSHSSTLLRRIGKEHRILSTSLPPGIYVRTFAPRLDLLRILLLGPTDTPYSHAPFLIDIYLPPTYPQAPPKAFFHSWTNGSGAVNPNLYEDGKICLSLLGTWHSDERTESWSPARSTLLQLFVSIVGLVLVREPYYNEAGFEVRRGAGVSGVNSQVYAERAYFGARGFVLHALQELRNGGVGIEPFAEVLEYLYHSTSADAPRLLERVISEARSVVARSEHDAARDDTEPKADSNNNAEQPKQQDGEGEPPRVSLGAVVMLRRQIERMEALRRPVGEGA